MDAMRLIKSHARRNFSILRRENFYVEFDELVGEIGLTYAIALKSYNAQLNNGASFETYLSKCVSNRINTMRREITKKTSWEYTQDVSCYSDARDLFNRVAAAMTINQIVKKVPYHMRDHYILTLKGSRTKTNMLKDRQLEAIRKEAKKLKNIS